MARIVSLVWGSVLVLVGGGLLAWIAYNVFVEPLATAQGRSPFLSTLLGVGALWAGVSRIRRGLRAPRESAPGAK